MRFVPLVVISLIAALGLLPAAAQVRSPEFADLLSVFPSGGQRGKSLSVTLRGKFLHDPVSAVVSGGGVEVRSVRAVSPQEVSVDLAVSPGAIPGVRALRVAGRYGVSDPGWFVIGALPELLEAEPNPSFDRAQAVELPVVVNGRLPQALDVDCFRFKALAKQPVTLAVSSFQLDAQVSSGRFLDATLTVYDGTVRTLAASEDHRTLDPALVFVPPADGEYVVEVRDMGYQGDERGVYRLTMGAKPYPTALYPAGGRRGTRITSRVVGLAVPEGATTSLDLPSDATEGVRWVLPDHAANAVPFIVGDLPEALETEPNDSTAAATPIALDSTLNGRMDRDGDVDLVAIELKQGEGLILDVTAGRVLRSPIDLEASVLNARGEVLQTNDDSTFTLEATSNRTDSLSGDPRLEFTAPQAGRYFLRIRDLGDRGGPDCIYRATVTRLSPGFGLVTWYDNPSIKGPGGTAVVMVMLRRWGGFSGPLKLSVHGLPAGYVGSEAFIPRIGPSTNVQSAVLTITAPMGARVGDLVPFRIEGEAEIGGKATRTQCESRAHLGQNADHSIFRSTESCVACVVPVDEWRIGTTVRHLSAAAGETVKVPVSFERAGGYAGPISLLSLRGNYLFFGPPVTVPDGATTFDFPLRVPEDLEPGEHTFVLCRPMYGDFRSDRPHTSTPTIRLTVTKRTMTARGEE